jgi:two-component system, OmpR family, response regulator
MARVLLIDDDAALLDVLSLAFEDAGHDVARARDGREGVDFIERDRPDLVVTDVNMPGIDGFSLCRRLREAGDLLPLILLTSRDDEIDEALGLELGADDYVAKPFSPRELMARVKAVLRRAGTGGEPTVLRTSDVELDLRAREVTVSGERIRLTQKEFDLLSHLVAHPGVVYTREELLEHAWQLDYPGGTRTVDVHIAQVRRKLGRPDVIETVHGVGYKTPRT